MFVKNRQPNTKLAGENLWSTKKPMGAEASAEAKKYSLAKKQSDWREIMVDEESDGRSSFSRRKEIFDRLDAYNLLNSGRVMTEEVDHHGHSPAAWTAVISMLIGFALLPVALFVDWEIG